MNNLKLNPIISPGEITRFMIFKWITSNKSSFPIGTECQYLLNSGMLQYTEDDKFIITDDGYRYFNHLKQKVKLDKPELLNWNV